MLTKDAMFESSAVRDTRWIAWVKRACVIVVSVYLVIGIIAAYRALVQGGRSEIVGVHRVPKNEWSLLDPRPLESSQTVFLTEDIIKGFVEGEAIVRATVIRRQQLGRHPPPVVRERVVKIQRGVGR